MGVYDSEAFDHHDSVHFIERPDVGLRAIMAIHDIGRGPACGGTRRWVYESEQHATDDALRLARAMSYKNVLADLPIGGGKAVIMARPGEGKSAELLEAYGEAIESLGGRYVTTEDVGITCDDIAIVGRRTGHVVGLPDGPAASGDPSPFTAYGVFLGIRAAEPNEVPVLPVHLYGPAHKVTDSPTDSPAAIATLRLSRRRPMLKR